MGKQTMGVPSHTIPFRSDSKSYAIQTPQCPMVRPDFYKEYGFDDFPLGKRLWHFSFNSFENMWIEIPPDHVI